MNSPFTLSVIKADVGGFVGHSSMHSDLIGTARKHLETVCRRGAIIDFHVLGRSTSRCEK